MTERIKVMITDLIKICRKKKYTLRKRLVLVSVYLSITVKRFFSGRSINPFNDHTQSMFGYKVYIDNYSDFFWIFREIFIDEEYYFKALDNTPYIVDCGGNIGLTTIYFKWLYPKAKILVFEPEEENIKLIKKNIFGNSLKNVELVEKAIGSQVKEITLYGNRILSTIHEDLIEEQHKLNSSDREHKSVIGVDLLSNYLEKNVFIDYLKMDIEGAEAEVISDLKKNNLIPNIRKIGMEYHMFAADKNLVSDIIQNLTDGGHNVSFKTNAENVEGVNESVYYNYMLYSRLK